MAAEITQVTINGVFGLDLGLILTVSPRRGPTHPTPPHPRRG